MSDWIRLICILLLKHCQSIHIRSFYVMSSQEVRKLPYTVHKLPGNSSLNVRSLCPVYPVCPGCPCFPVCPDDIMTMTTNANHDHDHNDDHDDIINKTWPQILISWHQFKTWPQILISWHQFKIWPQKLIKWHQFKT